MDRLLIVLGLVALVLVAARAWRSAADRRELPRRIDPSDAGLAGSTGTAVVAFTTRFCRPCQQWEEALAGAGVDLVKLDLGARPELARRYRIAAAPVVAAISLPRGDVLAAFDDAPAPGDVERVAALLTR